MGHRGRWRERVESAKLNIEQGIEKYEVNRHLYIQDSVFDSGTRRRAVRARYCFRSARRLGGRLHPHGPVRRLAKQIRPSRNYGRRTARGASVGIPTMCEGLTFEITNSATSKHPTAEVTSPKAAVLASRVLPPLPDPLPVAPECSRGARTGPGAGPRNRHGRSRDCAGGSRWVPAEYPSVRR